MSKVKLRGLLTKIGEIEAKNESRSQRGEIEISQFNPSTGEPLKKQTFPFSIFGERIEKIQASKLIGKKVDGEFYLNSGINQKDDKVFHNLYLSASAITEVK